MQNKLQIRAKKNTQQEMGNNTEERNEHDIGEYHT